MATIEVIAWKDKQRTVRYYTMQLYNRIAADIANKFKRLGYAKINIRVI